jgi:hypothetical protein
MKIIKCLALAICPLFFALAGCYLPRPTLQASFVDPGGTMVWSATGRPFQVYWFQDQRPCLPSDSTKSDGRNNVVCHAFTPGSYSYFIDRPADSRRRERAAHPVLFNMHVGTCNQCSILLPSTLSPQGGNSGTSPTSGDVNISCVDGVTKVDPPTGPAGLTVGSSVVFNFNGTYAGPNPMTLTFLPTNCSNNQDQTQNFVITGVTGYCTLAKPSTISYAAKAGLCSESKATLSGNTAP